MLKKITITLIITLVILSVLLFFWAKPYYFFLTKTLNISIFKTLFSKDSLKTFDNQINILFLGIAGGENDGPNLSDTIIVANYNFKNNALTTFSLPRDIWSDTLKDKLNSAYAYGESKQPGGGFKLAKAEIGAVINQPIQYAVLVDFDEFKKLVDDLGGLDINVEKPFIDKEFPIPGRANDLCGGDPNYRCRYETISFKKGLQHMNGETVLKFVRSRRAQGEEGSDFARNIRQQLVIKSVKNKILEEVKNKNINKLTEIYNSINKLLKRDITNQQLAIIAKNILLRKNYKQQTAVIDEKLLYVPDYSLYEGHYVLMPINDDFSIVHNYIKCKIENNTSSCLPENIK